MTNFNTGHPPLGFRPEPNSQIVAYVRSGGIKTGDDPSIRARLYTTLNAALGLCRPGLGDTVVVLPGHVEDVSAVDQMSNLVAGTRIVGIGRGAMRPTFTWTATASSFLFDQVDVSLENCVLQLAGDPLLTAAITVTAPITVSADGCAIRDCFIRSAVDADQLAALAIEVTAADCEMTGCRVFGGGDGTGVTTILRLTEADRFYMADTLIDGATSSTTVGVLQMLTTASTQVNVERCTFLNRRAASIHAATGMVGSNGTVRDCHFLILDGATLAGWETEGDLSFFNCTVANTVGEAGAAKTPISA